MNRSKKGFTIIEFVLALAFIGIILVSICLITIQITGIYQKGLALRAVNSVGRQILDDMTKVIAGSPITVDINPTQKDVTNDNVLDARAKYFYVKEVSGTSGKRQASGIYCTGSYDYVWNTAETLSDATNTNAILVNNVKYKLVRIPDTSRELCATVASGGQISSAKITESTAIELINSDEADLAIYDLTVYPGIQSSTTRQAIFPVSFILATRKGGININSNGDFCTGKNKPYNDEDANNEYSSIDFNYCAVNRFDFIARQTGESSDIDQYGSW